MIVVSDATPLIALAKVGRLELLKVLFGTIGLLLLAKRLDKEVAIRPLLDELRSKKFYVSDRVYQLTLKQAGE